MRFGSALRELSSKWDDPHWRQSRLQHRIAKPVHRWLSSKEGCRDPLSQEWDNLLILDACRAEWFESTADLDLFDSYKKSVSCASQTPEWLRTVFAERELGDTVYVTANPYSTEIAPDSFHKIIDVSRDGWDSDLGTVPADEVADAAVDALDSYPNKRLLIHFLQPHTPFVESDLPDDIVASPFEAITTGRIERASVEQAYLDNLSYVLNYVESLIEELPNRTVVSADHGEMLGERAWPIPIRCYGHIPGIRTPELNDVPWAVVDGEPREVTNDGVSHFTSDSDSGVEGRLKALGYK